VSPVVVGAVWAQRPDDCPAITFGARAERWLRRSSSSRGWLISVPRADGQPSAAPPPDNVSARPVPRRRQRRETGATMAGAIGRPAPNATVGTGNSPAEPGGSPRRSARRSTPATFRPRARSPSRTHVFRCPAGDLPVLEANRAGRRTDQFRTMCAAMSSLAGPVRTKARRVIEPSVTMHVDGVQLPATAP